MAERDALEPLGETALRDAAARMAAEFEGVFGPETIEQVLTSSRDRLAAGATVPTFLPLLAERYARQRLAALVHAERKQCDGAPDPRRRGAPGPGPARPPGVSAGQRHQA